jgi:aminoglycoside phosphotransferase (APT) family kinase protein
LPVVAKQFSADEGLRTYANMVELWNSTFGERRRPPGLPRPIAYHSNLGALIMERIEGRPLIELESWSDRTLCDSMQLLACLHECAAQPPVSRDSRRIVRSMRRKAESINELAPEFAAAIGEVVDALAVVAASLAPAELVATHGDFSPRNVLVASDRLVLIDWDRFQRADPARDVAYMGAWCWTWSLRQGQPADWTVLDKVVAVYDALRPAASIQSRIRFYVAAGLVRIAHSLVRFWRDDIRFVPQIASEAMRQLR